ncbi:transcription initiation factor TFIID subunit 11 isoform X1 [Heterodontus francisci]|uniref:transcription initiation factor TFIID subunit 11 isoform X1 n=1 Tax=Heterodontus francisci TaxID=7792 RepID=UPI00355BC75C
MDLDEEPKFKLAVIAAAAPVEPPKAGDTVVGRASSSGGADGAAEQPGPSSAEAEVNGRQAHAEKPAEPRDGAAEEEDDEEGDAAQQAKKLRVEPVRDKKDKKQKVDEDEIQKMQILVSSFSEEQLNRYEMYRRSAFPKAAIKRKILFMILPEVVTVSLRCSNVKSLGFVNSQGKVQLCKAEWIGKFWTDEYSGSLFQLIQSITGCSVSQNVVIAMSGISKVFVGEVMEEALDVCDKWGETPPLQPKHMREAVRRLKLRGQIPNTKYKKVSFH